MIVDCHAHIVDRYWLPDKWWSWYEKFRHARPGGQSAGLKWNKADPVSALCDPTGDKLIDAMDASAIDTSVVLPLDFGLHLGEAGISIEEQNIRISEIVNTHPSRLIGFVGVDPRRANAVEIIETGLERLGMKGVKLYPGTGFSLYEECFQPLWDMIATFDVPVMIHTGQAFGPLLSRYCAPSSLDDILALYPEITLIAAHMGGGWFDELCWMGYTKPNLYTDISLWQLRCRQNRLDFTSTIRKALDMFGPDRVMFGTDWPFTESVMAPGKYVQAIEGLAHIDDPDMPHFLSAEIRGLLGENCSRLLAINSKRMQK